MTTRVDTDTKVYGAARSGRGSKLHPAVKTLEKNGRWFVWVQCSCPNTQNGRIYHGLQFFAGAKRTCLT
jgi:hypothetical protein